jgi:hypothetical protein
MRRFMLGVAACLWLVAACGDDNIPLGITTVGPHEPSSPGPGRLSAPSGSDSVAVVLVSPTVVQVSVGATAQVVATATDANSQPITGATFSWASADRNVASVRVSQGSSATAFVTGVSPGSTVVTATSGAAAGSTTVTVLGR